MEIDYLVMLSILRLHKGKSIKFVESVLSDEAGINDITIEDVLCYLFEKFNINVSIKNLSGSIDRFRSMGHLSVRDGRVCPSVGLVHYFVEILQYEENINESFKKLTGRMEDIKNK